MNMYLSEHCGGLQILIGAFEGALVLKGDHVKREDFVKCIESVVAQPNL